MNNNHATIRYFLSVPHSHFSLNNLLCFKNEAVVDERPTIIASGCWCPLQRVTHTPCVYLRVRLISAKRRCCGSWWTCVQLEVSRKGGHGGKNKTFSLSHTARHPGWVDSFQADSHCVPKCVHVTRSWHNRPASFVSWAYSDMVHHDLSLDNMCRCHELSFVAGVFFWRVPNLFRGHCDID